MEDSMKRMFLVAAALLSLGAGTAFAQSLAHEAPPASQHSLTNGD
jgi:hypothetical protein